MQRALASILILRSEPKVRVSNDEALSFCVELPRRRSALFQGNKQGLVISGLDPAIPMKGALISKRDRRDKPGDDEKKALIKNDHACIEAIS